MSKSSRPYSRRNKSPGTYRSNERPSLERVNFAAQNNAPASQLPPLPIPPFTTQSIIDFGSNSHDAPVSRALTRAVSRQTARENSSMQFEQEMRERLERIEQIIKADIESRKGAEGGPSKPCGDDNAWRRLRQFSPRRAYGGLIEVKEPIPLTANEGVATASVNYFKRLLHMVPVEAIGLYLAGDWVIKNHTTTPSLLTQNWPLVVLVLVCALRYWALRERNSVAGLSLLAGSALSFAVFTYITEGRVPGLDLFYPNVLSEDHKDVALVLMAVCAAILPRQKNLDAHDENSAPIEEKA